MVLRQGDGGNIDPPCSWQTDRYRELGSPTPVTTSNLPIPISIAIILKVWTQTLNTVHTFSRPLRFMRHTETLRTLHSYGRNRVLMFLQALTATHLFSRPTRLMKLTQTIQGTYVYEAKAPPVVGMAMVFRGVPEQQ